MAEESNSDFDIIGGHQTETARPESPPGPRTTFFQILGIHEDPTVDEIKHAAERVFSGKDREQVRNGEIAAWKLEALAVIEDPKKRKMYRMLLDAARKKAPILCRDDEELKRYQRACRGFQFNKFRLYPDHADIKLWHVRWADDPDPRIIPIPTMAPTKLEEFLAWIWKVPLGHSWWTQREKPIDIRIGAFFLTFLFWIPIVFLAGWGIIEMRDKYRAGVTQERLDALHDLQNEEASAMLKLDEVGAKRDTVKASIIATLGIDPTEGTLPDSFRELLDKQPTAKEAWADIQNAVPSDGELTVRRKKLSSLVGRLKQGVVRKGDAEDVAGVAAWADEHLKLLETQGANRDVITQYQDLARHDEDRRNSEREKE